MNEINDMVEAICVVCRLVFATERTRAIPVMRQYGQPLFADYMGVCPNCQDVKKKEFSLERQAGTHDALGALLLDAIKVGAQRPTVREQALTDAMQGLIQYCNCQSRPRETLINVASELAAMASMLLDRRDECAVG